MLPLSGESRADRGLELAHPKISRRTKTRRVTSRALGEGKCKGNTIPTLKTGNKPTQRSCSFSSQGVEKVTAFLTDIMGRRGKETTGFSHCCTTCLEIKPSEQKADPVLLLNKSGLFPVLELVLHRLSAVAHGSPQKEGGSFLGTGGHDPGQQGKPGAEVLLWAVPAPSHPPPPFSLQLPVTGMGAAYDTPKRPLQRTEQGISGMFVYLQKEQRDNERGHVQFCVPKTSSPTGRSYGARSLKADNSVCILF